MAVFDTRPIATRTATSAAVPTPAKAATSPSGSLGRAARALLPVTWELPICGRSDALAVSTLARRLALESGFSPRRAREVALVVCELASNIVRHAVRGELRLAARSLRVDGACEVEVVARDQGPPIRDLEVATLDGNDGDGPIDPALLLRRGGLGTGLGAVLRLSDRFEVRTLGSWKEVVAVLRG